MKIDLIFLSESHETFAWPLGNVSFCDGSVASVRETLEKLLQQTDADALLLWDQSLGFPTPYIVEAITVLPGDCWHAGLRLGMAGLPTVIDCVHPTWMLNCDPDPEVAAASWRVSLRACLVKTDVLRQLGGLRPGFETLLGAGLEWGHRLIKQGAMLRHVPELLFTGVRSQAEVLPVHDELLFAKYRFPTFWYRWAVMRSLLNGMLPRFQVLACLPKISRYQQLPEPAPYQRPTINGQRTTINDQRVTVLLPTIERYPYLRVLLDQLRKQTIPPYEIIVIDQTPIKERDNDLVQVFLDLPLKLIQLDEPGQCRSRNAGLQVSTGDFILFLDDDDEVADDLIQRHLETIEGYGCDVSCGVADEVDAGPLPENFTLMRSSDVFPTNNTMIRREILNRSGLFDLAYDRGQRADGDLGMRVHLSGYHMILNPEISVLHHHAPRGGLRTHGQRVVTRAISRKKLFHVNLASRSDIYLAKRYFSPRQVRELLWINVFSTASLRGSFFRKLTKLLVSIFMLPFVLKRLANNYSAAEQMLQNYPQIDKLQKTSSTAK